MEGIELICFEIISSVGTARSCYIDAMDKAAEGDFEGAREAIKEGQEAFTGGHHAHAKMIQQEANGDKIEFQLLLLHAEDQLMSAEAFGVLAEKFITIYEKMGK
ncbi:MAG: PTS lactose/cellobiose transporter subunit IIA [Erysipelotrichaceae bacterium]|nr:PTS lactose/cellobiose transporter subunit IIA [Erysipelotrichaceae bacterium]